MILRSVSHLLVLALMLSLASIGLALVWLAWGNNSCGWDGGSFDCPMMHPAWDVAGWIIAVLGLLAARSVAKEVWTILADTHHRQEASSNDPSSGQ
jgi:hypothetical protein